MYHRGCELCSPTGAHPSSAGSAARLENSVNLAAILQHLPGAGEPRGHHESIARAKGMPLAGFTLDDDATGCHNAQLVFRVAHAPFAACRAPPAGEELLGRIAEVVGYAGDRVARDHAIGRRRGYIRLDGPIQNDEG